MNNKRKGLNVGGDWIDPKRYRLGRTLERTSSYPKPIHTEIHGRFWRIICFFTDRMKVLRRRIQVWVFILVCCLGYNSGVVAQSLYQPDCVVGLLGKSLTSDSVRQFLNTYGINVRAEDALRPILARPSEGYILRTDGEKIKELIFFNDSIPYKGITYKRFQGSLPFGFTFSDSVGVEENLLFRQDGVNYSTNSDGVSYVSILTLSGSLAYKMQQGYMPAQSYAYYRKVYPRMKLQRNLYYRFVLDETPNGPYLSLPLLCAPSVGGPFSSGVIANRADSAYYLGMYAGYRGIARARGTRQALDDGVCFGINLLAPVSSKVSPPLHYSMGLDYAAFTYRDSTKTIRTSTDDVPAHNQVSFYFGFAYMPQLTRKVGFLPVAQVVGGYQFDYSPSLTVYTNQPSKRSSSSSLFYQVGVGAGYVFESGIVLQLMAQYRATRFARYLRYNTQAFDRDAGFSYPNLETFGTSLRTVSVELQVRINLSGQ